MPSTMYETGVRLGSCNVRAEAYSSRQSTLDHSGDGTEMCHSARHRTRRGIDWIGNEVRRHEDPDIRASDADRERVAQTLRDSATDGRIDTDALDERLDPDYEATT